MISSFAKMILRKDKQNMGEMLNKVLIMPFKEKEHSAVPSAIRDVN
jgi:hypothetical protein